jgi:hypothetical protein
MLLLPSRPTPRSDASIFGIDWQPIIRAPWERNVELAVIEPNELVHALAFPCRRTFSGWLNAKTREWIEIRPTHWRDWEDR